MQGLRHLIGRRGAALGCRGNGSPRRVAQDAAQCCFYGGDVVVEVAVVSSVVFAS